MLFRQREKVHPWHGTESHHFDKWCEIRNELNDRGFRFLWDYEQGREVLYADGGYRAQVFENGKDITRSLIPHTNLPILY